jgi:predicted transcriptional regulator of viral defense system
MGISRHRLRAMLRRREVEQIERGLYRSTRAPITENETLAAVAARVPAGIMCLLTALRFHDMTTQSPHEVWIALPPKARIPRLATARLHVARFSGAALTQGIETHVVAGVSIRVYSAAKTVADCFKYRNKIGLDVAIEAAKDYTHTYRGNVDRLFHFARICRVARVMEPYLHAIV